jgi:hypothetical protein
MSIILFDLIEISAFGFLSSAFMTLVEIPFWKKWGMEGVADWQVNQVMVSRLIRKTKTTNQVGPSWIIASKLLHGAAAGLVFRLLLPIFFWLIPISKTLTIPDGIIYGIILWAIFLFGGRRIFESAGGIKMTRGGLLCGLLALLIYGIFLGLFLPVTL